jgi:hypothetical protein
MESGTDIDLTDVWGIVDDQTGEMQVWVCGDEDNPDRSIVLALNDDTWQTVYERYPYGGGNSIDDQIYFTPKTATLWTAAGAGQIWVGGGWGIYTLNDPLAPTAYDYIDIETEVGYFSLPWRLRGTGENDLLVVGEHGGVFHYNGARWHWYASLQRPHVRWLSVAIQSRSGGMVVAVGTDYSAFLTRAVVLRGYR